MRMDNSGSAGDEMFSARTRLIISIAVLVLIVGSFATAVIVYAVDSAKNKTEALSGNTMSESELIIRQMSSVAPEIKTERVSYGAYRIKASSNTPEAILNVVVTEKGTEVTIQYEYVNTILGELDMENDTIISDYLDSKAQEVVRQNISEAVELFSIVMKTITDNDISPEARSAMNLDIYAVLTGGDARYLYVDDTPIYLANNTENEAISITIHSGLQTGR